MRIISNIVVDPKPGVEKVRIEYKHISVSCCTLYCQVWWDGEKFYDRNGYEQSIYQQDQEFIDQLLERLERLSS